MHVLVMGEGSDTSSVCWYVQSTIDASERTRVKYYQLSVVFNRLKLLSTDAALIALRSVQVFSLHDP